MRLVVRRCRLLFYICWSTFFLVATYVFIEYDGLARTGSWNMPSWGAWLKY